MLEFHLAHQNLNRVYRATGVTTAVVEAMENSFKKDILRELRQGEGRILLHDEVEERPGVFSIIPIWEVVNEEDIMTPRDVFNLIIKQGYHVRLRIFISYVPNAISFRLTMTV